MPSNVLSSLKGLIVRHRFLITLMMSAVSEQVCATIARVGTSYRAVELGVSLIIIGVITAGYSLVPIVLGVKAGRYVDLGHDNRMARMGASLLIVSCLGFAFSPHWSGLLLFNILNGVAHMLLFLSLQVMCARDDRPGQIIRTFGNLMVGTAIGQGIGSGLIALVGGSGTVADARPLFMLAALVAVGTTLCAFLIPLAEPKERPVRSENEPAMPLGKILATPGFLLLLIISIVSVSSADLLVIFLPLVGVERAIPVDTIGLMLTLRAVASVVSRMAFARLHELVGGNVLLVASTLAGGVSLAVISLPVPLWIVYIAIVASGFALGIATTVSLATSISVVTPSARGTATSLRMVGNRLAQFFLPALLGIIAAATGAGAIFGVLGAWLVATSAASHWRRPSPT